MRRRKCGSRRQTNCVLNSSRSAKSTASENGQTGCHCRASVPVEIEGLNMATIVKEFQLRAGADAGWDALSDFGALHTRLVPGFVMNTTLEGDVRTVTFANGSVAKEYLVSIDDAAHRLVYG